MSIFGRKSTVYVGPGEAEPATPVEELVVTGAIQPGDPGHPATPAALARMAIIEAALVNADEAALASAAAATGR